MALPGADGCLCAWWCKSGQTQHYALAMALVVTLVTVFLVFWGPMQSGGFLADFF